MIHEITVRQKGPSSWAWYIKHQLGHEGSPMRTIISCQTYSSGPDAAWRCAITALENHIDLTRYKQNQTEVSTK